MNVLGALICFGCGTAMALEPSATASPAGLEFDHVWIVVARDAPERAALEKAGLKISPDVNRHDGQGTASITADFQNSYIELMWPDPRVSVAPGAERGVEKFKNRMNWRTSGWCPIGIGLHRVGTATRCPRGERKRKDRHEGSQSRSIAAWNRSPTNHRDSIS